jgi:hypothetical protein
MEFEKIHKTVRNEQTDMQERCSWRLEKKPPPQMEIFMDSALQS